MSLENKKCIPCSGEIPPLKTSEIEILKKEISKEWTLVNEGTRLKRLLKLKDFKQSIELANLIGEMAEEQWHHPQLLIGFGILDIEIWTHKINALVESDFIFAAKVDQIINNSGIS